MKTNQLFLLTGLVAVTLPACVQKDKKGVSEKPMNILYIMCDDHSYQTISAYDPAHLHKIHTYRNGELHSETSAKPRHDV